MAEGSPTDETCRKVLAYFLKDRCFGFLDGKVLWQIDHTDIKWICSRLPGTDPLRHEAMQILNEYEEQHL